MNMNMKRTCDLSYLVATLGSTLKPYEPATTKLKTSSQELGTSSTTTRSTDLIPTSMNPESSIEKSIFNLVTLKSMTILIRIDPNDQLEYIDD
uniref:Uncharacterized protein n=1 Tax=Tetranychus urticae TaxID=32264 RepID=T1K209_TETUR